MKGFLIFFIGILAVFVEGTRYNVKLAERRNRLILMHRRLINRDEFIRPKVCYDLLGCFDDPHQPLALKRAPQHPNIINTKFHLYTRKNRNKADLIEYGDNFKSLKESNFNNTNKLKVIIHGFKGSGANEGAINGANAFLDLEDANVIIVDWALGAGRTYNLAVSNVELVGRQLGLILLDSIQLGINPNDIHVVGFSLGAHVAGCASEVLKQRNFLIGRITGLDPASPFFRINLLREKKRKLDSSDAKLIDVIHTDGSADFLDGFGLLKSVGHIDFFPNGGKQQPGCNDVKNSVAVSHLNEDNLDINIACSHTRAWFLFVESMKSQLNKKCKFLSWPCKRRYGSYSNGHCFPPENRIAAPEMGYAANKGPTGDYYLVTRANQPFCGYPMRIGVKIPEFSSDTRGLFTVQLKTGNSVSIFKVHCDRSNTPTITGLTGRNNSPIIFYDIQAVEYESLLLNSTTIQVTIRYDAFYEENDDGELVDVVPVALLVNKIVLEDRRGNRWDWCQKNMVVGSEEENLILRYKACDDYNNDQTL